MTALRVSDALRLCAATFDATVRRIFSVGPGVRKAGPF